MFRAFCNEVNIGMNKEELKVISVFIHLLPVFYQYIQSHVKPMDVCTFHSFRTYMTFIQMIILGSLKCIKVDTCASL